MTAQGSDPETHRIVADADNEMLDFECRADLEADCRIYPSCSHEDWGQCEDPPTGDCVPTVHAECWMGPWVQSDAEGAGPDGYVWQAELDEDPTYRGEGVQVWKTGPVEVEWHGDFTTWDYA